MGNRGSFPGRKAAGA